jgi:hypothetical protein
MPALKNRRHEAFAIELFKGISEGATQAECYSAAGYTDNHNAAKACASRLLKSAAHIVSRVKELQTEADIP